MKRVTRNLYRCVMILLLLLLAVFLISNMLQRMQGTKMPMTFGWGNAVILTGSMEPAIPVNAWVLLHATNELDVGDIIAFQGDGETPVTHRITDINGDSITTKGDANSISDEPIHRKSVIGKVILIVPPKIMKTVIFTALGVSTVIVISEQLHTKKQSGKERKQHHGKERTTQ